MLLADGRFPSGAHAHSGGIEAAVAAGLVAGMADLDAWVTGCLHRQWLVEAAVAVHAAGLVAVPAPVEGSLEGWLALDAELVARTTAPLQRRASRVLGRQLLRAGRAVWPHPVLATLGRVHAEGPSLPLVQGAVAAVAGLDAGAVARTCLYGAVQGAATAAVRLLGLDPYGVTALVARQADPLAAVADSAVLAGAGPAADLPAAGGPMLDVLLAAHAAADMRLFTT